MPDPLYTSWTSKARSVFLAALRSGQTVSQSAAATGLSRETAYRLRRRNARFARAWALALDIAQDNRLARLAADRRPREPFMRERAVMYRGDIVGYRRTLDATALLRTLARLDRQIEADLARTTESNISARQLAEPRNSRHPLA